MPNRQFTSRFFGLSALLIPGLLIVSAVVGVSNPPSSWRPAVSTSPRPPSPFLQRDGDMLVLNGQPYRFTGVNAYSMATMWGENMGCGGPVDPDALFASLPPRASVRIWAWQGSMATKPRTGERNWRSLDRVVAAAERHGALLILSLTSQAGDCDDGHWKGRAWYDGGYLRQWNDDGYAVTTTSYWNYVHEIVSRYSTSPAIGIWELVNEPEASECPHGYSSWRCAGHLSCPNENAAAVALRHFFDVVGAEIRRIDPNHLIGSGVIGGGQCGTVGQHYAYVHASPGIDVASYHDYGAPDKAVPGDQWNGLEVRLQQSRALAKPLIVGESGIAAADGTRNCPSRATRSRQFRRKLDAMFAAGINGFLTWNAVPTAIPGCTFDIAADDPALSLLRTYQIR